MKQLFILVCISVFTMADELQRMESIVQDIEKLRSNYVSCVEELNLKSTGKNTPKSDVHSSLKIDLQEKIKMLQEYKALLEKERLKNTTLITEIDRLKQKNDKANEKLKNILETKDNYEKSNASKKGIELKLKYENILKNKEKEIFSLKNQINHQAKAKTAKQAICEDDNQFPKLMMKENLQKKTIAEEVKLNVFVNVKEEKVRSKARTYRLNKESKIHNDVDGKVLYTWETKTSFTSARMTENWLEITGYFLDRKWKKSQESLWVKKVNATAR